jgi:uncharacterized protein (DUF2164 family)
MEILLSKEQKAEVINEIQRFFLEERGEEIGELAAETIFYFIKENVGTYFYNKGIEDSKTIVEQKIFSVEEDLEALKRIKR